MSTATDAFYEELRKYLRCAVCQKRVESVSRGFDMIRCTETATVRCHGAIETVTIPSELIEEVHGGGRLSLGLAFDGKLLAEALAEAPATG